MQKIKDYYDKIYRENEVTFGQGEPEETVREILKHKQTGKVLELGAGEGRNSLFLAAHGFQVEAIDVSGEGLEKLRRAAQEQKLKIETRTADISSLVINKDYDVMVVTFVLHHLSRAAALKIIETMKVKTLPGGVNVISSFTKDGDFYQDNPSRDRFYLAPGELKKIYAGWKILKYSEEKSQAFQKRDDGKPMFNVSARIVVVKP